MSKADEMKYNILRKYVNEINKMYKCGCWVDWISVERMAQLMNISKYKARKAFKELAEDCESVPWLYCKAYVLTNDAFEKVKELRLVRRRR